MGNKYIDNLKIELLGNEIDQDKYAEQFVDATYQYFIQNKIPKEKYVPFYDYIKNNYVYDRVELHKLLRMQFSTEAAEFVDVWIDKENKKKVKEEVKVDKIESRSTEFSTQNVKELLLLKERDTATELIVQEILKNNNIYTLRHDEKEEIWIYKKGIYIPEGKTYIKEFCRDTLGKIYTTHLGNLIIDKIETDTYIKDEDFFIEEDPNLVALQNGIFNLKTKRLMPFDNKYFFFQKLPIEYDKKANCRNIKKFIESTVESKDVNTLQEIFGYLLYRDMKYEKAFMFNGNGRNGKGKTVELMKRFVGVENCSNISLQRLESKSTNFDVCELHNKLANISADLSNTALKETGEFKSLVGHDMMYAQRKFKTPIRFTNYAKMIFCSNELPQTSDITHAFFNRWVLIDFPYTFYLENEYEEHKDEELSKLADTSIISKISTQEELNGLFNWALEGFDRLFNNNGFSDDKNTSEIKNLWIRRSDSFAAFCNEHLAEEWEGSISKQDLVRYYSIFCRINKTRNFGEKHIKSVLERTFGVWDSKKVMDDAEVRCWNGIKFKDNIQDLKDKYNKTKDKKEVKDGEKIQEVQKTIIR